MQKVILFDIDGVIADSSARLHHILQLPQDWEAFDAETPNDLPIDNMITLCNTMYDSGICDVILVTGRSEYNRDLTEQWLEDNDVHYDILLMRPADDHRPAKDVKMDLIHVEDIRPEDVLCFFEDEPMTCNHFSDHGYIVGQINSGMYPDAVLLAEHQRDSG